MRWRWWRWWRLRGQPVPAPLDRCRRFLSIDFLLSKYCACRCTISCEWWEYRCWCTCEGYVRILLIGQSKQSWFPLVFIATVASEGEHTSRLFVKLATESNLSSNGSVFVVKSCQRDRSIRRNDPRHQRPASACKSVLAKVGEEPQAWRSEWLREVPIVVRYQGRLGRK